MIAKTDGGVNPPLQEVSLVGGSCCGMSMNEPVDCPGDEIFSVFRSSDGRMATETYKRHPLNPRLFIHAETEFVDEEFDSDVSRAVEFWFDSTISDFEAWGGSQG